MEQGGVECVGMKQGGVECVGMEQGGVEWSNGIGRGGVLESA